MKMPSKLKMTLIIISSCFSFFIFNRVVCFYLLQSGSMVDKLSVTLNKGQEIFVDPILYINTGKASVLAGMIGFFIPIIISVYYFTLRRNFLFGKEHGSAEWGTNKDIKSMVDKIPEKNMLFTQSEKMSLNTRKTFRNNNILVVGGAGSGKTRFFLKPNLMQMHTSYVVTDSKGQILPETGKMLADNGYKIKVLDLDTWNSDFFNPFVYLKDDTDILKLVKNIMTNTNGKKPEGSSDFWEKAEEAFLLTLFTYVFYEGFEDEKNIPFVCKLMELASASEEDESFKSPLDFLIEELTERDPEHIVSYYYNLYKKGAGKTAKSILISVGVRLTPFAIPQVKRLLSKDTLELDTIGDEKTALFVILPDTHTTFNFIAAMMYQQLFETLVYKADKVYGGRLPIHVRCLLDEFANMGLIPNFEILIATIRSREISVNPILQNLAQLKNLYKDSWETITGNCDTFMFLGGKEQSTLEMVSKMIGKTTIDLQTVSKSFGTMKGNSVQQQVLGRDLLDPAEVGLLGTTECILSVRGLKPFRSKKFDITKHKRYKELSDYNSKNTYCFEAELAVGQAAFFYDLKEIQVIELEEAS